MFQARLLSQHLIVYALMAGLLTITGCSSKADQEKISQLEIENAALKQQVQDLQTSAATTVTTSTTVTAVTAVSPPSFVDVDDKVPAANMINDLAQLKVFEGLGTEFKPYQPVMRGEYVTWLFNAYNAQHPGKQLRMSPSTKLTYTDISDKHPAYKYIQAFTNAGFSVGYDPKSFKPDQPITREEMIAIKYGVDSDGGKPYSGTPDFSDKVKIDPRFERAIYSDYSIMGERGNIMRAFGPLKTFKPKEPVQRFEAAATLWQTDNYGNNTAGKTLGRDK